MQVLILQFLVKIFYYETSDIENNKFYVTHISDGDGECFRWYENVTLMEQHIQSPTCDWMINSDTGYKVLSSWKITITRGGNSFNMIHPLIGIWLLQKELILSLSSSRGANSKDGSYIV